MTQIDTLSSMMATNARGIGTNANLIAGNLKLIKALRDRVRELEKDLETLRNQLDKS